jgi:hypothetical protein
MRGKRLDLAGKRFGKLVVIRPCGKRGTSILWLCKCDCGNTSTPAGTLLNTGQTKSCSSGCSKTKHGQKTRQHSSPVYNTWAAMKSRCGNPNNSHYHRYGGRGIKICEEWLDDFQAFYDYMGPRDMTQSIDRIDNDGNYEPGNVRWVTKGENTRNRHKEKK